MVDQLGRDSSARLFTDRIERAVFATAIIGGLITLIVSVLPFFSYAYRSPGTHVAIETTASLVATVVALIVVGRFRRSRRSTDLVLAAALALLAATNLLFSTIPSLTGEPGGVLEVWAGLFGRAVSGLALLAAAFMRPRPVVRPRRALAIAAAGVGASVLALALGALLLDPVLPSGVDPTLSPEASGRPRIIGPAGVLALYLALTLVYAAAAVGFMRCAKRTGDELMGWLAIGTTVAAFSRLNYFLFPSIYSEWVYTGDVLRLAFYTLLLVGALREIAANQSQLAAAAVSEERRRVARDLHDGLAQDLAFIASQSHLLRERHRPDVAALIGMAANRALEESRAALATLTQPADEPFPETLTRTVTGLARRGDADVELDVDPKASPDAAEYEALIRIASEAVNNAVRHGGASTISVSLQCSDGIRMVVHDDGRGFTPEADGNGGFGLTSMNERARALGGELVVDSTPDAGCTVEVRLP